MRRLGSFIDRVIRALFRVVAYAFAFDLVVLGAHGIYVYSSRLEVLFGVKTQQLFLVVNAPAFKSSIMWMSDKAFQSWIIPAVFVAAGILLWKFEVDVEYFIFRKIPNMLRY